MVSNLTKLEHSYTVYARVTDMDKEKKNWYEDSIRSMANFSTAEQFWGMYQHLKRPSQMTSGTHINLFVKGIKPMWEVDEHKEGGVWNLRVNKGYANKLWEDLILGFIGE